MSDTEQCPALIKTDNMPVSRIYQALQSFCENQDRENGWNLYWVSNGRVNQDHPLSAYKPLSIVAYVKEGNESPLIECGWIIRDIKKYRLNSQSVLPFYNLATIKVFCDEDKAWEIAKDITKFLEGFIWS